jgi:hypothetical protein
MAAKKILLRGALSVSALLLSFPTVYWAQVIPSEVTAAPLGSAEPGVQETDRFNLSPSARQAAEIIGVDPLLRRLSSLAAAPGTSLEELSLRQQITEAVMVSSLDLDSVVDDIDNERSQIVELQNIILARRQRAIGTTNLATLALSTGLGALSGVLQFSDTTKGTGNAIGFAAGGLSTLLSFHSLRQQHGGKRPDWVLPSMLAPFFHQPQGEYPADTWAYLNSTPPGGASNRRDQLLAQWRRAGRVPPLDSPQAAPKIALLTDTNAANKKLDMDLLAERAAMLADVRDEVSVMKRDLGDLLRGIRVSP